jgi:hypothetical protein
MCCRLLLLALISKQEELLRVGTVLNERFMQPDVAVAADEFILITAAMRYGFAKQVVHRKLQSHMTAVRRQHRQHVAATAGQLHPIDEDASADGGRPAKQQRLGSVGPDACRVDPMEQAAERQADCRPSSSGSSRLHNAAAGATGSKPQGSSRGSSASRGDAPGRPPSDVASAQPSRSTDDSSAEPGPSGRRANRREQAAGDAGIPPEQLVGHRIKVWWQMDEAFYCGVVTVRICWLLLSGAVLLTSAMHWCQLYDSQFHARKLCSKCGRTPVTSMAPLARLWHACCMQLKSPAYACCCLCSAVLQLQHQASHCEV